MLAGLMWPLSNSTTSMHVYVGSDEKDVTSTVVMCTYGLWSSFGHFILYTFVDPIILCIMRFGLLIGVDT